MKSNTISLLLVLLNFMFNPTRCHAAKPEIKCANKACLFEVDDQMELICSLDSPVNISDVTFFVNNDAVNFTSMKQTSISEVRVSTVAVREFNGRFATCKDASGTSQRATLHVLSKPKLPKVTSCQRIRSKDPEDQKTFQCTWQPILAKDSLVVHQLFWSRRGQDDQGSSLEWKTCPHQTNGACTWHGNSSQFFSDDGGSTDGWENCVVVVAHNVIASENLKMRNHTSEMFCFSTAAEVPEGMSAAAVAGITLGVVGTILLVVGAILYFRKQRKKMKNLKIEVPEGSTIPMEDKTPQESYYYTADSEAPAVAWRDSWISNVTTPSTGNSTAPLLNSDHQHFSFPNCQGKNYVKSKLPGDKSRLDRAQTKDQTDLLKRLLAKNEADAPKGAVKYAVIKSQEANSIQDGDDNKGPDSCHQSKDNIDQSVEKVSSSCSNGRELRPEQEDGNDFEDRDDGMYTVEIPWSASSTPGQERNRSSPSKCSMTSYTAIAPSPARKHRDLALSNKPSEDV